MNEIDPPADVALQPSPDEADALIARAAEHPLGIEFLRDGMLDAVAAIFQVHAFVVDQARDRLRQWPGVPPPSPLPASPGHLGRGARA